MSDFALHASDRAAGAGAEPPDPSPLDAAERAVDAAQRLVVDHLRLARLHVEGLLAKGLRTLALIVAAALVALPGWIALVHAAARTLAPTVGHTTALAILGAAHLAVSACIVAVARRRAPGGEDPS